MKLFRWSSHANLSRQKGMHVQHNLSYWDCAHALLADLMPWPTRQASFASWAQQQQSVRYSIGSTRQPPPQPVVDLHVCASLLLVLIEELAVCREEASFDPLRRKRFGDAVEEVSRHMAERRRGDPILLDELDVVCPHLHFPRRLLPGTTYSLLLEFLDYILIILGCRDKAISGPSPLPGAEKVLLGFLFLYFLF